MKCINSLCLLLLAVIMGCGGPQSQPHAQLQVPCFSVSDSTRVVLAPGNLAEDGKSFVASQLADGGLFGWDTGDNPTNHSEDHLDYPAFHDWGDNLGDGWRSLSVDEWRFLLFGRARADSLWATGRVEKVRGLLLLPDRAVLPEGICFRPGSHGWDANAYTLAQWGQLEAVGAAFLPSPGFRWGDDCYGVGCEGIYWTSSSDNEFDAHCLYFSGDTLNTTGDDHRFFGNAVRLAREVADSHQ